MKLVCPGCGLVASAEAWVNDAACRETIGQIVRLPHPVPQIVLPYLSLFRPEKSALSWVRAGRLVADLAGLVTAGHVQVKGGVARPCPAKIWAEAMEDMVARRDRISRPLKNHNYLRRVACDMAEKTDAQAEYKRNETERSGNYRTRSGRNTEPEALDYKDLTEAEMNRLPPSIKKRYGVNKNADKS